METDATTTIQPLPIMMMMTGELPHSRGGCGWRDIELLLTINMVPRMKVIVMCNQRRASNPATWYHRGAEAI